MCVHSKTLFIPVTCCTCVQLSNSDHGGLHTWLNRERTRLWPTYLVDHWPSAEILATKMKTHAFSVDKLTLDEVGSRFSVYFDTPVAKCNFKGDHGCKISKVAVFHQGR